MNAVSCPICGQALSVRLAKGRKSGKPFVMLVCCSDGRHFRGFITHQPYVQVVIARLEGQGKAKSAPDDVQISPRPSRRSKTKMERGGGP